MRRVSVSYHGPWLLCVCGNSCCHIFIVEQPRRAAQQHQGSLAGHSRLWHLGAIVGASVPARLTEPYLPGPGPGCTELWLCFFSSQGSVPTKTVALKCSGQSRKSKHQGNAGAGIRRGRRLVMRSELCVLGKLIRWLSLIRDWPGTVQGDNRCPQDTMGGELRPHTHTEGGSLHLTKWIF